MTDYVYWVKGDQHRAMCVLSIASVRAVDPLARVFVYSDEPGFEPLGDVFGKIEPGQPAMVANIVAQLFHVRSSKKGTKILFLDADTLLCKPFPFDDGLGALLYPTWRDYVGFDEKGEKVIGMAEQMPYNYGVLGVIADQLTLEAFVWMRYRVLNMGRQHQAWFGNQFALAELCGNPKRGARETVPIPWAVGDYDPRLPILRLPCETWNYSPEKAGEDVSDKGILHMKGGRKDLMETYA